VGLVTIACHLVKEAKRPELLGDTAESRAVVQQWMEFRVTKLDSYTKEDIKTILKVENLMFREIRLFPSHPVCKPKCICAYNDLRV